MRPWKHRLKLKDLLGEDTSPQATEEAAKAMHERLEAFRSEHFPNDDEIEQISDEFHTIAFIDGPKGEADADYFNAVMNSLYDWADAGSRLWID